jgi:peptidoglycan/LPS O-acetylase OafA/YrhL
MSTRFSTKRRQATGTSSPASSVPAGVQGGAARPPAKPGFGFRQDLEGLRAVAVALVVVYHLGIGVFPGGFVGVDVFFVLSGFLITALLLKEVDVSSTVSLRQFWARRARRLFAASGLTAVVTLLVSALLLPASRVADIGRDAIFAAAFAANFAFASAGEYLTGVGVPSPLQHYWSLAVEEQFYLVWPLVVLLVARRGASRIRLWVGVLAGATVAGSLTASVLLTASSPGPSYYLLHTRAWEMAAGALLACVGPFLAFPRVRALVGWAGGVAVLYAAFSFSSSTVFPGFAAMLPVVGTLALIVSGDAPRSPARLLSNPVLGWVGTHSFALYLWHWPVLVLWEEAAGGLQAFDLVGVVVLSTLLAAVSYRLVEDPVRRSSFLAARPARAFAAAGSILAVSVVVALLAPSWAGPRLPAEPSYVLSVEAAPTPDQTSMMAAAGTPPANHEDAAGRSVRSLLPVPGTEYLLESIPNMPSVSTDLSRPGQEVDGMPLLEDSAGLDNINNLDSVDLGTIDDIEDMGVSSGSPVASPSVLLVGDSTLALLRWFPAAAVTFSGENIRLDAESCRRLDRRSCKGREDRRPNTVVNAIVDASPVDVVVVMAGYHSSPDVILSEFRAVVDAARQSGASRVVWLSYRESLAFPARGSRGTRSVYAEFNEILTDEISGGLYPELFWADWDTYAADMPWFEPDGIHTNLRGTFALGEYVASVVAHLTGRPCPHGASPGTCFVPTLEDRDKDWLARYGVSGTTDLCYEMGQSRKRSCRTVTVR